MCRSLAPSSRALLIQALRLMSAPEATRVDRTLNDHAPEKRENRAGYAARLTQSGLGHDILLESVTCAALKRLVQRPHAP